MEQDGRVMGMESRVAEMPMTEKEVEEKWGMPGKTGSKGAGGNFALATNYLCEDLHQLVSTTQSPGIRLSLQASNLVTETQLCYRLASMHNRCRQQHAGLPTHERNREMKERAEAETSLRATGRMPMCTWCSVSVTIIKVKSECCKNETV